MCVNEARKWYREQNPSSSKRMSNGVPMYQGRGFVFSCLDENVEKFSHDSWHLSKIGDGIYMVVAN